MAINLKSKMIRDFISKMRSYDGDIDNWPRVKREIAEEVSKESRKILVDRYIRYINSLYNNIQTAFRNLDYDVKHVIISNKSRLTIMRSGGTGEVIYEIGLSLHPILGIPYVPSSSIKGSYRNALYELLTEMVGENSSTAITKLIFGEKLRKEEKRILMSIFQKNESLEQYFDGHLSWIEFFDAYPYTYGANNYLIIPDVMTPHYKGDVKTEFDVSPTPLIHLVIPEGIKFRVVFAYNKKYLSKIFDQLFRDNKYAKKIDLEEILLDTLKVAGFLGIGGRTSLGYSSFEVVQDES